MEATPGISTATLVLLARRPRPRRPNWNRASFNQVEPIELLICAVTARSLTKRLLVREKAFWVSVCAWLLLGLP